MTLRKRTLIIVGLTAASLILILYVTLRTIVLSSFAELEEQHARQNVERALSALSDNLAALDTIVFDWAAWDDTYVFIEDANEDYIQSNLVDETFTGFKLNLMLFVNPSGQTIFGKGFDLYNEEEASVPESLAEHLADDALLLRHPDTESSVVGIVSLPEGPMLVVSRPILTSEEKGPIRGALVMGRYLDSAESEHLAEITRLSLTLHRFDDSQMPLDFQTARSSLSEEAPILVHPLSAESVAGYALLKDIYGEPSLILRVDMPRDIYAQGQASMLYLLFSLSVVGLVFGVVASLLMDRMVLSRLARLSSDVNSIGASADLSTRVLMTGDDELSSLADTINEMLAALEQAQSGLQESERRVRDVTRTTGDWIWEMDTEGRYTYVSPVVEQILGYTPEEVLGRRYEGFLHPGDLGTLETLIQGISRRKEPFVRYVHQSLHKDGHLVILEATGLPLTDAEGNLLGYRGAHRDVTAERRLEERLAAVYALGRELVLSRDMQQITETTVEAARLLFHCQLCELWLVDEEKRVLVCQASKAVEPVEYIPTLPMDGGKGITAAVAQSGEPLYVPLH
jgi:PAS domain S-box-containing protein